ncbi:MAG: hypothetical protein R2810_03525 [Flavobacteriales bacterium]
MPWALPSEQSFSQYVFSQRGNMVDLDNDGLDAFMCHDVDANVYFSNDGSGTLQLQPGRLQHARYGSIFVDVDNDRTWTASWPSAVATPV